jgi:putative ABC transport system permease protein
VFTYYLELAARSLRRSPGLTGLMILAIGFGVAASMTTYSVFRGLSADPIPWKSSQLFVPQIDAWGPDHRENGEPPTTLTYVDAMALMRQHRAFRQSAIVALFHSIMPPRTNQDNSLIEARGYAVYSDFFPMLDLPFHYGSGWSKDDDASQIPVVVISDHFNEQMFGGGKASARPLQSTTTTIALWVLSSTGTRNRSSSIFSGMNAASQTFFYRLHSWSQTT